MNTTIYNSILASFVADTYSLGAHWIYDEDTLKNLDIDWTILNSPNVEWHNGKNRGDFTHYGDQSLFLLEYIQENKSFDKIRYYNFWSNKMSDYKGYIDGATKNALENINSSSNDLSICGRISPLLLTTDSKEEFIDNVKKLTEITHNTPLAIEVSSFFANLLWDTKNNQNLRENIQTLKKDYPNLSKWIDTAISTKDNDSIKTLQDFGVSCNIDGGFLGVIHLLHTDFDFKTIMIKNAKAGGDSSARAMIVAMLLGMDKDFKLPKDWLNQMNKIEEIKQYMR